MKNIEYEVGKYYNVRCAKMMNEFGTFYFVPIIGEPHADNQFGFSDKHYHIDGRFVGISEQRRLNFIDGGLTNQVCSFQPTASYYFVSEVVIKRRKCKRLITGLKPPPRDRKDFFEKPVKSKYYAWVDTMIGKSCKGKKCPHLGTTMIMQDGKLFCPLHNLVGCPEKEIIIEN